MEIGYLISKVLISRSGGKPEGPSLTGIFERHFDRHFPGLACRAAALRGGSRSPFKLISCWTRLMLDSLCSADIYTTQRSGERQT